MTAFLAEQTNEELGLAETDSTAIQGSQFSIDSIRFAEDEGTKLAVVQSHFTGGGPLWTVSLYFDSGSVPRYSYMFLARLDRGVRGVPAAAGPGGEEAQGVPDRGRRARLVRPRLGRERNTMIANLELPFLEQGSVQFILMGIMILAVFAALWVTISK